MTQHDTDALQIVVKSEPIMRALRTIFDETIEQNKPRVTTEDTDEVVGQKYRAYDTAKQLLITALDNIEALEKSFPQGKGDTRHI
jgi:hypothetical protein